MVNLSHGDLGNLPQQSNNTVKSGTDRRKVVQRNKRVHLEVCRAQQSLDHGQSQSLKHESGNLDNKTNENKVDLADGGDDDSTDNHRNVEELPRVELRHAERPAREEHSHGHSGLEHLDKSHGKIEIGNVAANEAQTEEDSNRDDSAHVHIRSHLDGSAAVK